MIMTETKSEADKTDDSELIKNMRENTDVFISHLICLWVCLSSLIWLIMSRGAVVMNLKWIDDKSCSITHWIAHWRQWWCLWNSLSL